MTSTPRQHLTPLVLVSAFFLLCGFSTTLNDSVVPYLQDALSLNYTSIMLIQLSFYLGYFSASPATAYILSRIQHKKTLILGVAGAGLACLVLALASHVALFYAILFAFYLLGSSIACLQVSCNAYAMQLGTPETASSRLTIAQAFNSVGTVVAPMVGARWILTNDLVASRANPGANIPLPYIFIGAAWLCLAITTLLIKMPAQPDATWSRQNKVAEDTRTALAWGFFAIFAYVGAEVTLGSFLVKFLQDPHIGDLPAQTAGACAAFYWGGMMIGRFAGAALLRRIATPKLLAFHAAAAFGLISLALTSSGLIALGAVLLVGLCNSIMFPTIFSLAMSRIGVTNNRGAAILTMGNIGGALVPITQGYFADHFGLHLSFCVPLMCFVYIIGYALSHARLEQRSLAEAAS